MTQQTERELQLHDFCKWAESLDMDLTQIGNTKTGDINFSDCNTDYAWEAWQAARSTVEKMLGEVEQWLPIETAQKPSQTLVMRTGDMCQVSRLMVVIDGEGDVGVRTTGKNMVEFCTAQGGGRSPRTREALLALMVAIEADAAEREQLTSITHVETSIYAAPSSSKEQS